MCPPAGGHFPCLTVPSCTPADFSLVADPVPGQKRSTPLVSPPFDSKNRLTLLLLPRSLPEGRTFVGGGESLVLSSP